MKIVARSAVTPAKTTYQAHYDGKTYFISTYPNSKLLWIEAGDTRRNIPMRQATKIVAAFREALKDGWI